MYPTPPFILDDHGDLSFYSDLNSLLQEVEAIDVVNDEYRVFDSHGRKFKIQLDQPIGKIRRLLGILPGIESFELAAADESKTDELHMKLSMYLQQRGVKPNTSLDSLANMIEALRQIDEC